MPDLPPRPADAVPLEPHGARCFGCGPDTGIPLARVWLWRRPAAYSSSETLPDARRVIGARMSITFADG